TVMGKNGVPMNSSGYHPAIMVLCEENFQDTDPRRLKARLALYERFYEDGVTDDNAPRLSQYILKTASFEMKRIQMMRRDRMTALRNIVTQQYIVPNLVEYRPVGMSRQQRRAYERRQRRQGSRGKR
ncbi:MAG TPA: hypothetical protein VFH39_04110, partial [Candidatus Saccharimonadales bacterium]|nr:hypothetical protein [Candidatus Saccharimonadales bacterium]